MAPQAPGPGPGRELRAQEVEQLAAQADLETALQEPAPA
jgi:hypothetical protein